MRWAPGYLAYRFFYRIYDFFHNWYVRGTRNILRAGFRFIAQMERTFALKETALHFFEPLYRDYSVVGRIVGPFFRAGRIVIALLYYTAVIAVTIAAVLIWISIPVAILAYAYVSYYRSITGQAAPL